MERVTTPRVRVGVFGIGLHAYWEQFPGLKQRLEGYQGEVEARLRDAGADVISAGLVDSPPLAREAGVQFARQDIDLIICYVGTYATSSQVVPAVRDVGRPVLVLNLQPSSALDYERTDTSEWLANCSVCCVPELAGAFTRSALAFNVVSGLLRPADGPAGVRAWQEIGDWVAAAGAARALRTGRLGFLGHTYPGMLDLYSDFTMITGQTGLHVELLEMDDLQARVDAASDAHVQQHLDRARQLFEISEDSPSDPLARAPHPDDLARAARVSVGLDALRRDFALDALAYYYRGLGGNAQERLAAGLILGTTLLTGRGVPCAGEGDAKTAIAMLIMDRLGAGGSFSEFCTMDFIDDFLLMGHDGPFHPAIAEGRPILRELGLFHGKSGHGLSVEARVKTGPVTILTVTQTADGRLKMLTAEAESRPGPTLRVGNTTSRIAFPLPPAEFVNRWCDHGPTHHCALGIGHHAARLAKVGRLLGLEVAHVC
ncbi:MAG TPA: L-fucose/L-arabinose isomerase family protein [Thermomicrobiales bacterium]|nr:L-fucose/L-arabinose isomerase family protein [Thermomicrobiales bacterium]